MNLGLRCGWGCALLVATCLAYVPAMRGGFIWDDDDYVTENATLRDLDGLRRIWLQTHATPQYYPLVHTSFWIEYHLWGLKPAGYHVTNVLLHATSALLLWSVLRRLNVPGAGLAAAVFALHPVQVESVAWITERKNVLSGVFYLLAALAWVRYLGLDSTRPARAREWQTYALGTALFICALLSKTVTCTLPAVLLLLLWWKRERLAARDLVAILPLFAVGLGFGLVTAFLEKHQVGALGQEWAFSLFERGLIAGRVICFYLLKLVWPTQLTFIYPRWQISSAVWWQSLYAAAVFAIVVSLWLSRPKIGKGPLVAIGFFVVTLTPALGFMNVYPMRFSFVADHFQYLASIGPIALLCAVLFIFVGGLSTARQREPDDIVHRSLNWRHLSLAMVPILLGCLTWHQGFMYKDLETLWRVTIAKNPSAWLAHLNLSRILLDRNDLVGADFHCHEAYRLKPDEANVLNNLGLLYQEQKRTAEAESMYRGCLRLQPGHVSAHANLGRLLSRQGKLDEAGAHLEAALSIKPKDAKLRLNYALVLASKGAIEAAMANFGMIGGEQADSLSVCTGLAQQLVYRGYDEAAVQVYRYGFERGLTSVSLLNNIAWVQATSPHPRARNGTQAVAYAEQALALSKETQDPSLMDTLAAAWAEAGNFSKAIEIATKAREIATGSRMTAVSEEIGARLEKYARKEPWRDLHCGQLSSSRPLP